jgi:hypothetical protein
MKEIQLTQGKVALVDDDMYEYLNQWKWQANKNGNKFYAKRSIKVSQGKQKTISMHRFITKNINPKMHTDHLNGNGLDNRKINLRICTNSQNAMNQSKQINNTSGYKGVSYYKNSINKKWMATIKLNNIKIYLGLFIDPKDAASAYNAAAIKFYGEFAKLNKID